MPTTEINGTSLHYEESDEGFPLLLLPGLAWIFHRGDGLVS